MTHTEATINLVSEADGRAIREVVSKAQKLQNNTSALMELHHPDVVIVNLAGRRVLGREAFNEA